MHKRWILQAFLLAMLLSVFWRLSCYLVFLLPYEMPAIVFTLCQEPLPTDFVFCPHYTPLHAPDQTPPYPLDTLPFDDYSTLIGLKNFKFLNRLDCGANRSFLVAVVHSAPAHIDKRQSIRSTWGTKMKTFFMIGESNSTKLATKLNQEMVKYGDIVQGSFVDSYQNMTYKHVMVLKWVSYWCQKASYILKTDDDVFVHVSNLNKYLRRNLSSHGVRGLILCSVIPKENDPVHRSFRSKWRLARAEYPRSHFPIRCYGFAIVYSPDVVFKLYSKAQKIPYMWIDDAHITGTVASLVNVTPTDVHPLYGWDGPCEKMILTGCLREDLLFCLTDGPEYVERLWNLHQSIQPTQNTSEHWKADKIQSRDSNATKCHKIVQ